MIVFSAFVPHSPLLMEKVGKDKNLQLKKTLASYKILEQELYASKPDAIIVIGAHSQILIDSFSIPLAPTFHTSFKEIGDFTTTREFRPENSIIQNIKEESINKFPLVMTSEPMIDFGMAIPLHLLAPRLVDVPIVLIHHSLLSNQEHYEFGKELREIIEHSGKRVAIIAAGDLAHCLTAEAPAPYNETGKKFDDLVKQSLKKSSAKKLLELDERVTGLAQECGLKPLLILMGIMSEHSYRSEILSYEYPFGVGYLTAHFIVR